MTKFTTDELDGKSVEFETQNMGTSFGTLTARPTPDGMILGVRVTGAGTLPMPIPEVTETFETLRRHPIPERAEFLLVKNEARILAAIDSWGRIFRDTPLH